MEACRWVRHRMETTLRTLSMMPYSCVLWDHIHVDSSGRVGSQSHALLHLASIPRSMLDGQPSCSSRPSPRTPLPPLWPAVGVDNAPPSHQLGLQTGFAWSLRLQMVHQHSSDGGHMPYEQVAVYGFRGDTDTVEGWPLRSCSPPGSLPTVASLRANGQGYSHLGENQGRTLLCLLSGIIGVCAILPHQPP